MKLKPIGDRIVVRRVDEDSRSAGGIIIPDTAKEKPMYGLVISVGEGKRTDSGSLLPMPIKEGDKVLFAKWSGTEVKTDGEELLIMNSTDVLAIVE